MFAPNHMYPGRSNQMLYAGGGIDYNLEVDYMREEEEMDHLSSDMANLNIRTSRRGGHSPHYGRGGYQNMNQNMNQNMRRGGRPPNHRGPGGGPRVCKFFLQNKCTRGPNCNFAHIIPTLGRMWNGNMNPNQRPPQPDLTPQHQHPQVQHLAGIPQESFIRSQNVANDIMMSTTYNSIEDVRGRIYALSRTQNGCRALQRLLEKDRDSWEVFYEELKQQFSTLVTDPFGHHLCLRLLDFINSTQVRESLLLKLKEDLVAVSLSVHGTRVIQKLLEMMQTTTELRIVQESMTMFVITLSKDVYGMHVILRCLHRIPPPSENNDLPSNQFIFDEITKNIVSVATHKHGCCVVQWCIDYATPIQRQKLVDVIVQNSLELSQDAFGNYVVQQIMDPTHPGVLQKLVYHLQGSITKLAVQKFSSIVIEKCLEYTEAEQQMDIITELVNPHKLPRLLQDPYANYVIQKALSVTRQENFQEVVAVIRPHLASLSNTPFGKRIKTKMIRRFPILSMGPKKPYVFDDEFQQTQNGAPLNENYI